MPFVLCEDVTVQYGASRVFENLSFEVDLACRCLVICGLSGRGKTTLLRTLAGIHRQASGRIEILGGDANGGRFAMGFLPQTLALLPWRNVVENVEFGMLCGGLPKEERHGRAMEAIAQVGLRGCESKALHELSGGMLQRVALARALAVKPACLLLDEPFSALDFSTTTDLCLFFTREMCEATRFIIVTHDVRAAAFLADSVAVVRAHGEVALLKSRESSHPRPADYFHSGEHTSLMSNIMEATT
jgi:ABC-type nitrate/sulfonate/bicarbonate transport system ATPase subunit